MLKTLRIFAHQTLLLTTGSLLCAFAVKSILVPQGFLSGGLTGMALIAYYCRPQHTVGLYYILINIPVFILGFKFVGTRFILYSLWGMALYSALLFVPYVALPVTDTLLAACVAGGLTGGGMAIMLRSFGSGGGSEIISIIVHKLTGLSIGTISILFNSVVLGVSALLFPVEKVLSTLVYIFVSARITDMIFHGLAKRQAVMIISQRWEAILEAINTHTRLGVTVLAAKGGYRGSETPVLYSVINRGDVIALKKLVARQDPGAFITISDAHDVTGEQVGNQPHW